MGGYQGKAGKTERSIRNSNYSNGIWRWSSITKEWTHVKNVKLPLRTAYFGVVFRERQGIVHVLGGTESERAHWTIPLAKLIV